MSEKRENLPLARLNCISNHCENRVPRATPESKSVRAASCRSSRHGVVKWAG
jgi:hypothetical protein